MMLAENVLRKVSRSPQAEDLNKRVNEWNSENSLDLLKKNIPNFSSLIPGQSFVDFGCGFGEQSFALLQQGASHVLAVDINTAALERIGKKAEKLGVADRLSCAQQVSVEHCGSYDFVISQNSMEHFPNPAKVLRSMSKVLKPSGKVLMTFGPPWYAPYGSHMHFFTKVPWVNILFSERTVLKVRSLYRDDGAQRYEDVAYGLNKMSVRKFETLIANSDLQFQYRYYQGVKNFDMLTAVPVLRELFTNQISCILEKA